MTKLLQESGELCSLFSRNLAKLADVWYLKPYAGTLFVLLLKSDAVLNTIWCYEWLFDGTFLVGGMVCVYCYRTVLRLLKLLKRVVGKLDLSRGGGAYSVSRCVRPWINFTLEYPFNNQIKYIFSTAASVCVCCECFERTDVICGTRAAPQEYKAENQSEEGMSAAFMRIDADKSCCPSSDICLFSSIKVSDRSYAINYWYKHHA